MEIHPFPTPDLSGASIGKRIRYLRRKLRLTPADLAAASTISPNALLNLEREDAVPKDWVVGRILNAFGDKAREAFPGVKDVYDFLAPPTTFGGWLRNLRLRRGLKQADLAKSLGVSSVSVAHYESDLCRPRPEVQDKLKKFFKLNGELSSYFRRHE